MSNFNFPCLFVKVLNEHTGWGFTDKKKKIKAKFLKQLQMPIQATEVCTKSVNSSDIRPDYNVMFCAGENIKVGDEFKMVDTCQGDSGGPFVVSTPTEPSKYIQIGIVSHGYGCKKKGKYGFYTKLNPDFLEWIATTVKEEDEKKKPLQ